MIRTNMSSRDRRTRARTRTAAGCSSTSRRNPCHTWANSTPSRRRTGSSVTVSAVSRSVWNSRGAPARSATRYHVPALATSPYGSTVYVRAVLAPLRR